MKRSMIFSRTAKQVAIQSSLGVALSKCLARVRRSCLRIDSFISSTSWEESAFTPSIASYEPVFGQDIDGDGSIGVDIGTLEDITTDTLGDQLKVDSAGGLYIWDGTEGSTLITVKDETGGSPSMNSSYVL